MHWQHSGTLGPALLQVEGLEARVPVVCKDKAKKTMCLLVRVPGTSSGAAAVAHVAEPFAAYCLPNGR
jgi:hypothetical protein